MAKSIDKILVQQVMKNLATGYGGRTMSLADLLKLDKASVQNELNPNKVKQLMTSIVEVGKMVEPIIIYVNYTEVDQTPIPMEGSLLVAGAHRREALKLLCQACHVNMDTVQVPIIAQSYGAQGAALLATNTSRRFSAWEKACVKIDAGEADDKTLKTVAKSKMLREGLDDVLTAATLLKLARWCTKVGIDTSEDIERFRECLHNTLYYNGLTEEQAADRQKLPTNISRYWLKYAEFAYDLFYFDGE